MVNERKWITILLLNIVTCGLYALYMWYKIGEDVNTMCADDGKTTMNFFLALLLGCVTCNIYLFVWMYKVWDRVDQKAQRLGGVEGVNSAIVSLLIGFVPVYSFYYVCETMNKLARRTGTLVSA